MDNTAILNNVRSYIEHILPELDDETWEAFVSKNVFRHYAKGEALCRPGMVCKNVSFVCQGLIRTYYLVDGKEIITSFSNENCYCSEYESFLPQQPSRVYLEALEDTIAFELSYDNLQELYRTSQQCEKIGRKIAEGLFVYLSNRNSSFMLDRLEVRYEKFLEEYASIIQRVPQYMIASYLGITPEALSRMRSRLSKQKKATANS